MTATELQQSVVWHHEELIRTRRAAAEAAERFDRLMRLLAERRWATETRKGSH
jgi:hypothetical protein